MMMMMSITLTLTLSLTLIPNPTNPKLQAGIYNLPRFGVDLFTASCYNKSTTQLTFSHVPFD